jgi:hypothetical protein
MENWPIPPPRVNIDPASVQAQAPEHLQFKVKEMQRMDREAKDQWIAYTDMYGQGRRDPSRHTGEFLQEFLNMWYGRKRLPVHEDAGGVGDMVRVMGKKSASFKKAWLRWCEICGHSETDPSQHHPAVHVKFLDYIADKANLVSPPIVGMIPGVGMVSMDGPVAKKPRTEGGGKSWETGDPAKDKLIMQIKAFQRQSDENRDMWRRFCDDNHASVLDPARHEASVLFDFVARFNVPEPDAGFLPMDGPVDPAKEALVVKIKSWQRGNIDAKEAWYNFCGHKRDPARHELVKLQEFCALHSIA